MESPTQNTSSGNVKENDNAKQLYGNPPQFQEYIDDPKQLFQQIQIRETPFLATKTPADENNAHPIWSLTMGKYRLGVPRQTLEEVLQDAQNTTWMRILQVIHIMIEDSKHEDAKLSQKHREETAQLAEKMDKLQQEIYKPEVKPLHQKKNGGQQLEIE